MLFKKWFLLMNLAFLFILNEGAASCGYAYVTNAGGSNTVSVIQTSTNTVVATVTVGTNPENVAVTPDGSYAYVTNFGNMNVSVIRTSDNTVVATVAVDMGPDGVAVTPDGGHVYVTNNGSNNVSVIRTSDNTVVATVTVGTAPGGVAVTPVTGSNVYVSNLLTTTSRSSERQTIRL